MLVRASRKWVGVVEIFVDYNRIGRGERFETRLLAGELVGLVPGERVLVVGDDVDPREATLVGLRDSGRVAVLELVPEGPQ